MRIARRVRFEADTHGPAPHLAGVLYRLEIGPKTPRELAELERVSQPTISRMLATLAESGLIARTDHPSDRRQVVIALTDEGRALVVANRAGRDRWMVSRLEQLTDDELRTLERASGILQAGGTVSPTFRSLSSPAYRLFFVGSLVSSVGTWMARVAQDWLVLVELTDQSATALGVVTGLQFLPAVVLSPWAGLLADRMPKRRLLMVTQSGSALASAVCAVLVLSGAVQLWHVYLIALIHGCFAGLDAPARQSLVSEIVGPDLVGNAVGLNTASFHGARVVGPALAGLLIAWVGTGWAFVVNALSFAAILWSLWAMRLPDAARADTRRQGGTIREGWSYVASQRDLQVVLVVVFLLGTFGLNFQMTNALMSTGVYHRGPADYGGLGSIMAVGSLTAALLSARRARPRWGVMLTALVAFGVTSAVAAMAPTFEMYAAMLVPVGLSAMTVVPTANAWVQLSVPAELRGRVMSIFMAVFLGGTPLGSPLIGWIGQVWGPRWTILIGSIAAVVAAAIVAWHLRSPARNEGEVTRVTAATGSAAGG